ncbi:MAG: hypothetical protein J3K34DRAFT_427544 [Monoraphidium minutum]|nr:MAG: hypothetical protein J3K34DRAFT_427544 [Monoraphidium minutum]
MFVVSASAEVLILKGWRRLIAAALVASTLIVIWWLGGVSGAATLTTTCSLEEWPGSVRPLKFDCGRLTLTLARSGSPGSLKLYTGPDCSAPRSTTLILGGSVMILMGLERLSLMSGSLTMVESSGPKRERSMTVWPGVVTLTLTRGRRSRSILGRLISYVFWGPSRDASMTAKRSLMLMLGPSVVSSGGVNDTLGVGSTAMLMSRLGKLNWGPSTSMLPWMKASLGCGRMTMGRLGRWKLKGRSMATSIEDGMLNDTSGLGSTTTGRTRSPVTSTAGPPISAAPSMAPRARRRRPTRPASWGAAAALAAAAAAGLAAVVLP